MNPQESMDNMLPVKVTFEHQSRRFRFHALSTLEQFKQQCYTLFKIPPNVATFIMYVDGDADWITVEQEDEWVEAKRQLLLANDRNYTLRARLIRQGEPHQQQQQHPQQQVGICRAVKQFEETVRDVVRRGEQHLERSAIQGVIDDVTRELGSRDSVTRRQIDALINQLSEAFESLFEGDKRSEERTDQPPPQQPQPQQQEQPQEPQPQQPQPQQQEQQEEESQPLLLNMDSEPASSESKTAPPTAVQIPPSRGLQESWTFVEIQNNSNNGDSNSAIIQEEEKEEIFEEDEELQKDEEEVEEVVDVHDDDVQEEKEPRAIPPPSAAVPSCRLVSHVTFPELVRVEPNTTMIKTWKLQNTGKELWPEVMLAYCEGPIPSIISLKFITRVPRVMPGDYTEVSVELTAPEVPGIYRGSFRLATRTGECFGQSFGFEFETVPASPTAPAEVEEEEPPRWTKEIGQLEAMGFTGHRDELVRLLDKFKGDLQQVILKLIE